MALTAAQKKAAADAKVKAQADAKVADEAILTSLASKYTALRVPVKTEIWKNVDGISGDQREREKTD
jgi:hypothetical protein